MVDPIKPNVGNFGTILSLVFLTIGPAPTCGIKNPANMLNEKPQTTN